MTLSSRYTRYAAVVGVVALVVLSAYAALFVRSMAHAFSLRHVIALLSLWQTQTTGFFALAAAAIGAAVVLHQTTTSERLENKRRTRRAAAIRVTLPLILDDLCDYALNCRNLAAKYYESQLPGSRSSLPKDVVAPKLPTGLADQLLDFIESSDGKNPEIVTVLSHQVQIQRSRFFV